jgi:hypothetical protein
MSLKEPLRRVCVGSAAKVQGKCKLEKHIAISFRWNSLDIKIASRRTGAYNQEIPFFLLAQPTCSLRSWARVLLCAVFVCNTRRIPTASLLGPLGSLRNTTIFVSRESDVFGLVMQGLSDEIR